MSRQRTCLSARRLIVTVFVGLILAIFSALPIMADGSGIPPDQPLNSSVSSDGNSGNQATILVLETLLLLTTTAL